MSSVVPDPDGTGTRGGGAGNGAPPLPRSTAARERAETDVRDRPTRAQPAATPQQLIGRIRLQTAFRLTIAVILLASIAVIQWRAGPAYVELYDFRPLYWVTGCIFATCIPVALGIQRIRATRALEGLASAQFLIDIAITTVLVHVTGGGDSVFTFFYPLTILNASIVLYRRGALLAAVGSSISYGLLIDLSYFGFIRPFAPLALGDGEMSTQEALYRVVGHVVGFLMTGVLASYLADLLRRTGQELAEASIDLRELQALTKNIVENIGSGLLTIDGEGRITSFNRSAQEITGRPLGAVFGLPIGQVFPAVARRIARGTPDETRRLEEAYVTANGQVLALGFSYSPLRNDEGREIGTIVIFQDLSALRDMEMRLKREERLAAVGRLAAGIAHEIRNPLGAISGSIEMLRSSAAPSTDDARLMEIILRETDRLDGLIGEFLDYVKPLRRNPSDVDLHSVLEETAEAIGATELGRDVTFVLPPEGSVGTVRGDRDHLKQVVWNLFLNAAQAMGGKGTVAARVDPRSEDPLVLEFADDGPGIPAESMSRMFEPFFTTKERGTGLGLAMVHKIVEAHHGHIEVVSGPGEGARFRVTLPRHEG